MRNILKANNKNTSATAIRLFWCFYCKQWTYFTPFYSVSLVDFESENVSWAIIKVFLHFFLWKLSHIEFNMIHNREMFLKKFCLEDFKFSMCKSVKGLRIISYFAKLLIDSEKVCSQKAYFGRANFSVASTCQFQPKQVLSYVNLLLINIAAYKF